MPIAMQVIFTAVVVTKTIPGFVRVLESSGKFWKVVESENSIFQELASFHLKK